MVPENKLVKLWIIVQADVIFGKGSRKLLRTKILWERGMYIEILYINFFVNRLSINP